MPDIPDLVYYPDSRPGITRQARGRGFSYFAPDGTRIEQAAERKRLNALAVPPAYSEVWISPRPDGHLQATGRDARARKQYRYHPEWTAYRAVTKYDDLCDFGVALPSIRRAINRDLKGKAGSQSYAVAAILAMIDRLSMRVGHPGYTEENGSYGATTLRARHLNLGEDGLHLKYRAKGGKAVSKQVRCKTLGRVLNRLDDLPGATLVSWMDDDGTSREVTSSQINDQLRQITEDERMTAKTFRTWNGSVAALEAAERCADRVTITAMAEAAADRLGNTAAIARKSYIHPDVIALSEDRAPLDRDPPEYRGLRIAERKLLDLIA